MNKTAVPEAKDWDYFWDLDQSRKFTKISWSKIRIIRILHPFLKKGKRVLDAGCGSGFFSQYFCDRGLHTFSLDYSPQALQLARKLTQGRSTLIQKNLLKDSLTNIFVEKFDLIFTDGLLEHFSPGDQDKICRNLLSVLDKKGVLITFVPNRFSPWELIRPLYMPGIQEEPFTLSQLVDLNTRNGCKIIKKGGINTFPFSFSPDTLFGPAFGMLLYTVSYKV